MNATNATNARAENGSLHDAAMLRERYRAVRSHTMALAAPLSAEDCCVQSMLDASPVKWHLAHTTWFFETFILERMEPDFVPFHPAFRMLFNSYYNGVGDKHPRAQRGMLTQPALHEVLAYRADVDARMMRLLARGAGKDAAPLIELGMQHEQQHQELILTDLKHLLSLNPLKPAYAARGTEHAAHHATAAWLTFDAGVVGIGYRGAGFSFDNERPHHRQFVEPFALASRLVTNREYAAFIEAGGYRDAASWLADGWDWVCANRLEQPLYWQRTGHGAWQEFTLHGMRPLDPDTPLTHISYFEADAYARWAGARLPTEYEWERAAQVHGVTPDATTRLHPQAPAGGAHGPALAQMFGQCWQWTSSSYAPYPGFAIADGAIGEYNGKFMVNQYVLRGSSCATPPHHARISYRNFFPAGARWQFSSIRLARSLKA
jgi:ergothioneine biosynthesis protein EgtB